MARPIHKSKILVALLAACLALIAIFATYSASAATRAAVTTTAAFKSFHPGHGAYLFNRPGAYYMGRVTEGARFDRETISSGSGLVRPSPWDSIDPGSSGHRYWFGYPLDDARACLWVGPRSSSSSDGYFAASTTQVASRCTGSNDTRSLLTVVSNFGKHFNCPDGQASGPMLTSLDSPTAFHYNVSWTVSGGKYRAGAFLGSAAAQLPAGHAVKYRFTAVDNDGDSSNDKSVVYVDGLGWGFISASALSDPLPSGSWGYEDAESQATCNYSLGKFYLRNALSTGASDHDFYYGQGQDKPLAGQWGVSGGTGLGVFRPSTATFMLRSNLFTGVPNYLVNYGLSTDQPLVGDWDGNGSKTVGVFRNGMFYLSNSNASAVTHHVMNFGVAGDKAVAGDWDGDGRDSVGIYRGSVFQLSNAVAYGGVDYMVNFGVPGDTPLSGDWNGDGRDSIGIRRGSVSQLSNSVLSGVVDYALDFGLGTDQPVTSDWDNNGSSSIGVFR